MNPDPFNTDRRHEYAVETASNEAALADVLTRMDDAGYMIRNILATATRHPQEPLIYTVVGVRDREEPPKVTS